MVVEDLRVMELLASRICHDLISPVGAINNGIELLEEMGGSIGEEAVKLIGHSADQASRRLKLFRLCYGMAGADTNLTCDDVLVAAREYLNGSKLTITWDSPTLKNLPNLPKGTPKVLLNTVIIAAEVLVNGGALEISAPDGPAAGRLMVVAAGRGAGQRPDAEAPLKGDVTVEGLTAKSVHPYITGKFAQQYGAKVVWRVVGDERLELDVSYVSESAPL